MDIPTSGSDRMTALFGRYVTSAVYQTRVAQGVDAANVGQVRTTENAVAPYDAQEFQVAYHDDDMPLAKYITDRLDKSYLSADVRNLLLGALAGLANAATRSAAEAWANLIWSNTRSRVSRDELVRLAGFYHGAAMRSENGAAYAGQHGERHRRDRALCLAASLAVCVSVGLPWNPRLISSVSSGP